MSADDVVTVLRLVGLPSITYGIFAMIVWNRRTTPEGERPLPVFRAILGGERPRPPKRVIGFTVLGIGCAIASLVVSGMT